MMRAPEWSNLQQQERLAVIIKELGLAQKLVVLPNGPDHRNPA
jgi:hypothetical protein